MSEEEEGAKLALQGLLRKIARTTKFRSREKLIASIRKKCDTNKKNARAKSQLKTFRQKFAGTKTEANYGPLIEQALAAPMPGQDYTVSDLGMEFVWIAALKAWVGKYEVTNGEYRSFKKKHDSKEWDGHSLNGDRQPVVFINFNEARDYAKWLTERERGAGRLLDGLRYRLPAKDEWMTLAQCGDNCEYPWGNQWPPKYGNYADVTAKRQLANWTTIDGYDDGHAVTCPVEESGKNEWGLYGVGGNVCECTSAIPGGVFDARRGVSWRSARQDRLSCAYRLDSEPAGRGSSTGFRLVLSRAPSSK